MAFSRAGRPTKNSSGFISIVAKKMIAAFVQVLPYLKTGLKMGRETREKIRWSSTKLPPPRL